MTVPDSRYYGYNFHSRQPCALVQQKLLLGQLRDTGDIDAWLNDYFRIDTSEFPASETDEQNGRGPLAVAVARRALALYGDLIRAAGFPSFDAGRILGLVAVDDEPDCFLATIALPVVDHLPVDLFAPLFRACAGILLKRMNAASTPDGAEELYALLDKAIITPAKKFSPFSWTTLPVCELAYRRDIPFRHVGRGVVRLGWSACSQLLHHSSFERDSAVGAQICGSKTHTVQLLRSAGLPTPEHRLVVSYDAAAEAARELGWPVVVKPEHEARSEGVTIDVSSEDALQTAFDKAREMNEEVLVERQVPGICHRITVAGDKVIYVVKRMPKSVIGDGRATVAQLVEKANAALKKSPPWKRLKEFPLDELARQCLAKDQLTPESIPTEGQRAYLRPLAADEWGGDIEDLTEQIHPENARLAIEACRMFGLAIVGVDLMTTDIAQPWHKNGAVILELNYMPQVRAQKREDHAARLFPALIDGDGRIPVHLVTGEGDLLGAARQLKAQLGQQGRKCHLTSGDHSEDGEGREIVMTLSGLFDRSLALTMRKDVQELILAGPADELLRKGLAVDRLENVLIVDDNAERGELAARELGARFPMKACRRLSPETVL